MKSGVVVAIFSLLLVGCLAQFDFDDDEDDFFFNGGIHGGRPCNLGFLHKNMGFGKGYGQKFGGHNFAPAFHKSFQPMNMYHGAATHMYPSSSPIVSAGSISQYPSYSSNMYHGGASSIGAIHGGVSSMGAYHGGASSVGAFHGGVSSVGAYPSYQSTGNIY